MSSVRTTLATLAATLLLATGCGPGSDSDGGSDRASADASAGAGGDAFPATVKTKFGEVTVEAEPQRIVALGWGDAETVLALGGQPVGASDWLGFGAKADGVGPWAQDLYEKAPELIETLEPSYEKIGALEPDLILDTKSSGDQARYDRLSEIAPTIGVPEGGDSYLTTTEQQVELIAAAMGRADEGKALLEEVDDAFAGVAEDHPDWKGKTIAAATRTSEGWGAYVEGSERVTFLERLGFEQSPAIADLEPDETGFSAKISAEQLDTLDADLIVAFPIFIPTTQITDDPLWKQVPAVADGRAVVIDGALSQAYSLGTTLATTYAIEQLTPRIEQALS